MFVIFADFETYLARWAKGPVAAERTAGDGGAGSRYAVTARIGPVKVRSPYDVTAFDPPARLAGRGVAGPVRFEEEYVLIDHPAGTLLTQSIKARPRPPFGGAKGPIRLQLQQLIASDLRRLKAVVESEVGPRR